jgi:hypothetical protein
MIHTRQNPLVLYCGIFHLQNTFQCTGITVCCLQCCSVHSVTFQCTGITDCCLQCCSVHSVTLVNQNNATTFCITTKYLPFCKTFKLAPSKPAHWSTYQLMSQCCPLLPRYPQQWSSTVITFVCVHLYDWNCDCYGMLLCSVAVLLTVECNTVIQIKHNSNTIIQCQMLTALSVLYCKIRYDWENFHTNRHLRMKLCELAFSLYNFSVTFVTFTSFLSLSNCDTALAANSVSLKDLISGYVWLYNFKQASALHFRRHQLGSFTPAMQLNM